ncbi:type 1 glutamine amidotransferase [Mycobacterium sp. CVI_P3]|uniref:Type 1 glutamine amidotransferase n=1 Tax=Mycobacterium pinniadriaticum TaxID=2994102 RepID=A0ABT3SJS6_9MYCO|nr:type 1 glutamine amidotransferase [Mycobacterium pinniadriaticum]MCX2933360.1 type 1 glutamine amidotransferase [Mycobacterium pinniadriaticum]MCX2939782.1 type 1 glutamine amidotransferase [Mycobacterium pinniadriaticum]
MPRQVLFIYNDPTAPEALLGETFTELGFDVDTFEVVPAERAADPVLDVTFPDPTRYDVIVPLGSRWAVYDERLPWVAGEIDTVRRAVDAGIGVLGVCFGGQLVAAALGGSVQRSTEPEVGWHPVHSTDHELVPDGPWFQWHFDRFTAPPGAREIARNDRASQAFVSGSAMGLQFHPELDHKLLELWIDGDDGDLAELGLRHDDLRADTTTHVDDAARRLRLLVRGFLDKVVG